MADNSKGRKAYKFFVDAERSSRIFSLSDIAAATGWRHTTVSTYRSKKWHFFIQEVDGGLIVKGLAGMSEGTFLRIQEQKTDVSSDILRPRFGSQVDELIDKSRESALLAVQIYNNPFVAFRTPGFVVQMIIAYTALFHAIFEKNGVDYTYKMKDGSPEIVDGDPKAWDLSACAKQYFKGTTVPENENLTFFLLLRNKIEHRYLPAMDVTFSGKSQALLMNYETLLVKEFGDFFALGANLALALQFSTYTDDQRAAFRRVQSKEFELIRKFAQDFDDQRGIDITQSPKYSFRAYLVPKIGNHANSSDVAIEWVSYDPNSPEQMEKYERVVGIIRERQVQVANQGQLTATEVWKRVGSATGKKFGSHQHTCAWKLYEVRPKGYSGVGCKTEYCQYSIPFKQYVYTEKWVAFLCDKVNDPVEYERICNYREPDVPRRRRVK